MQDSAQIRGMHQRMEVHHPVGAAIYQMKVLRWHSTASLALLPVGHQQHARAHCVTLAEVRVTASGAARTCRASARLLAEAAMATRSWLWAVLSQAKSAFWHRPPEGKRLATPAWHPLVAKVMGVQATLRR